MSGAHLAVEVRRRFPGLPVVLMSGYSEAMRDDFASYRVLRKPVSYEQLAEAIREHLPAARMETVANK
jgi:DNA-binding NtrC family response regulator